MVYAAGVYVASTKEYKHFWGESALDELYDLLYSLPGRKIVAWNGKNSLCFCYVK